MSVISLPAAALASCGEISFELVRSQEVLQTIAGITQVTSFPDRRWAATLHVNPQHRTAILTWSLAIDQLSDRANVLALSPPYYTGPSTGYAGASPLVNGANQLGLDIDVDGLTPSTAILLAGDFISFDVTSARGNTNRELIKVAQNVTSNGAGEATIALVTPIRQAPANNAAVNITTPSAYFMLRESRSPVHLVPGMFSSFVLDLEERIFP
jgi:hypothetical protein